MTTEGLHLYMLTDPDTEKLVAELQHISDHFHNGNETYHTYVAIDENHHTKRYTFRTWSQRILTYLTRLSEHSQQLLALRCEGYYERTKDHRFPLYEKAGEKAVIVKREVIDGRVTFTLTFGH